MSDRLSPTTDAVVAKPVKETDTATRLLEDTKTAPILRPTDPGKNELPDGFPKTRIDSDSISFAPETDEKPETDEIPPASPQSESLAPVSESDISRVHENYSELESIPETKDAAPEAITSRDLETAVADREVAPEVQKEVAPEVQKEMAPDLQKVLPATGEDGPQVYLNGRRAQPTDQIIATQPKEAVTWNDPVETNGGSQDQVPFTLGGGNNVTVSGNRDFLNQFRFSGSSTISETTGSGQNTNVDFFPTRWNGVDGNTGVSLDAARKPDAERRTDAAEIKLTPEQEKAEREFLEKSAAELEKQNIKLKPLFKGEGPYQAIERMVRAGELPHMTSEQIKENAVRIRNRDFEQMKRGYYKVGETPEFFSQKEMQERMEKLMEDKRREFRQRLIDGERSAA